MRKSSKRTKPDKKAAAYLPCIDEISVKDRFFYESQARKMGFEYVAGVDEVGRGALAGPVLACAVILPFDRSKIPGEIRDSKKICPKKREELFLKIIKCATAIGIGMVDNTEIDYSSILKASLKAMSIAIDGLKPKPSLILVDGNQKFPSRIPQRTIKKGDDLSFSIGAASIVAKVLRDGIMNSYHKLHPDYRFDLNKGYGTRYHLNALTQYGCCEIHRASFRGVA